MDRIGHRLAILLWAIAYVGALDLRAEPKFPISKPASPDSLSGAAVCDLDGDGVLDAAFGSPFSDLAITFRNQNDGYGTLQYVADYPTGGFNGPVHLACGDLDDDGDMDLLVMGAGSGVYVLLRESDGTYAPGFLVPGSIFGDISLADFNNDDIPDFVTGGGGGIRVHLGIGDGTFQAPIILPATSQEYPGIATGDLDLDGNDDLVAGLNVRLGNGDGTFIDPGSLVCREDIFLECDPVQSVAIADFGGDGIPDIAVANSFGSVAAYRGNGDGTFNSGRAYLVPDTVLRIAAGDLDGDGRADLVAGYNTSAGNARALLALMGGDSDGLLSEPEVLDIARDFPRGLELADLSGDGRLDLLFVDGGFYDAIVLRGRGDGTFVVNPQLPQSGFAAVSGLFDGDPLIDVATADFADETVFVLMGQGDGQFLPGETEQVGQRPFDMVSGDFDENGSLDLVSIHDVSPGFITMLSGLGDGRLQAGSTFPALGQSQYGVGGDFNEDTHLDVIVAHVDANSLSFFSGNGDGTFAAAVSIPINGSPVQLAAGFLDADTSLDLAISTTGIDPVFSSDDELLILLGNGDGTFNSGTPLLVEGPGAVAIGDLDGSGGLDLAVGINRSGVPDSTRVYPGNGDGTFGAFTDLSFHRAIPDLKIVDMDADGHNDLVSSSGKALLVSSGNGDGTFGPTRGFETSNQSRAASGDFDQDGRLDVVRGTAVLLNRCGDRLLRFRSASELTWFEVCGASTYEVYRGGLSDLVDADTDGLPDLGYGACISGSDPDPTDESFLDSTTPPSGGGFFYLMLANELNGPSGIGSTGQGIGRPAPLACP